MRTSCLPTKKLLLSGTALLTVLALTPVDASAACSGEQLAAGDACTVSATGGDITQAVGETVTDQTPATPISRLIADGVAATAVTVEAGAGIVNTTGGHAIGAYNGGSVGTITNQGTLAANLRGATVFLNGAADSVINNGTASDALIRNFNDEGVAIWHGGGVGALTLVQGAVGSRGEIVATDGDAAGIFVSNSTGPITIHNINGRIEGATAADLTTSGHIAIVNGDGVRVGEIVGTGADSALILGGNNFNEGLSPSFSVLNNAGSLIQAMGAGETAVEVNHALGGASTIDNAGRIVAGTGGAAIDLTQNTSTLHRVTVTNSGEIIGAVKLGDGDALVLAGGSVTGDVTSTGSSAVTVTGDSAVSGSIGGAIGNGGATPISIVFQDDRALTLSNGSLNANVQAATDGHGTLNLDGVTALYHDVGTAGHGLKALNIASGVVDLDNSNLFVGTTTIGAGATLGMCTSSEDGCAGSTTADPANTFHGNLVVRGTLNLDRAAVTAVAAGPAAAQGDFTAASGSIIRTIIRGDGTATGAGSTNLSYITTSGVATLEDGVTVTPIVNGITISNGARYVLIDGTGTASVGDVTATQSALVQWRVLRGDDGTLGQEAGDVYLVASRNDLEQVVGGRLKGIANALTHVANDQAVQSLVEALTRLETQAQVEDALESLTPNASIASATVSGAAAASNANLNSVNARSGEVRTAQAEGLTGIATGDAPRGLGLWIQGLGFSGSQDRRKGQDGYDAVAGGVVVGGDVQMTDPLRVGVAFSYANSSVDATGGAAGSGVNIDSYQGTVYASYTGAPWYVDAALVYGKHQYDSSRAISFPGFTAVAKGDYSGNQYGAHVGGGYPLVFGATTVTPNASLSYTHLKQDGYTETGAGGANLTVAGRSDTSVRSGLGVKVAHTFLSEGARFIPEGRLTWFHDYNAEALEQTARFTAGGSAFTTTGAEPAADSLAIGLGLTIAQADQLTLSANYDAELKDKYVGHNGTIQVRLDF